MVSACSQEELTERAGLSQRGVSDLERSARHAPHFATVRLLTEALALGEAITWHTRSTLLMSAQVNGKRRATLDAHEATQSTVAIYERVSTEDQAEWVAIERQHDFLRRHGVVQTMPAA